MDERAAREAKRRKAREVVSARLRQFYEDLRAMCQDAEEFLRRALQDRSANKP
jgi:hypothetical protein